MAPVKRDLVARRQGRGRRQEARIHGRRRKRLEEDGLKPGYSKTPEFTAWVAMRNRCQNSNNVAYPRYGGRGLTVSPTWETFAIFFRDVGPRPSPRHTLERYDNNKGYWPNNVGWATWKEQTNNTRVNRILVVNGERKTLTQWSELSSVNDSTISRRLNRGWDVEAAIFTNPNPRHQQRNKRLLPYDTQRKHFGGTVTCTKCKDRGHNRRTCKGGRR